MANRGQFGLPQQHKPAKAILTDKGWQEQPVYPVVSEGRGAWHYNGYTGGPTGAAWPINDRQYLTWCDFGPVTVLAVGVNVTGAGGSGSVLRIGIYDVDPITFYPSIIRSQGTISNESTGAKTFTLDSPLTVDGPFWVAVGPQGSATAGSAWLCSIGYQFSVTPNQTSSTWNGGPRSTFTCYVSGSGEYNSYPSVTFEEANRAPFIAVRIQ